MDEQNTNSSFAELAQTLERIADALELIEAHLDDQREFLDIISTWVNDISGTYKHHGTPEMYVRVIAEH